jgi:Protein of unknown function (DUF3224)
MNRWLGTASRVAALFLAASLFGTPAVADEPSTPAAAAEKSAMARGSFTVTLQPQAIADSTLGPGFTRFSARKQFEGDLTGTSIGEMLGAQTAVQGSAGYVAIELVTGTLQGRTGTFVLQHSGTMAHGALQLLITIVPDSGTGQLAGISGAMAIKIVGKDHFYELVYSLPPE